LFFLFDLLIKFPFCFVFFKSKVNVLQGSKMQKKKGENKKEKRRNGNINNLKHLTSVQIININLQSDFFLSFAFFLSEKDHRGEMD